LLTVSGAPTTAAGVSSKPTVELLTNPRIGTIGVGLATGVLQPALAQISHGIGQRLLPLRTATKPNSAASAVLNDPLSTAVVAYRPFPSHAALGLSAFYLVHCSLEAVRAAAGEDNRGLSAGACPRGLRAHA